MVKKVNIRLRILKLLINNKSDEFSINQIASILKKDYKNTYEAVHSLSDSVNMNKKGNSCFVSFKAVLTKEVYEAELLRQQEIIQNKDIKLVFNDLRHIDNPLFIAVVFGSYAKKASTKKSDIDLCLIHNNKKLFSRLSLFPFNIEVHDFTPEEFISMLMTKQFNVGNEIYNDGVVLHNIESYYQLIKYGQEVS